MVKIKAIKDEIIITYIFNCNPTKTNLADLCIFRFFSPMLGHVLHVDTIQPEFALLPHLLVLLPVPLGETEFLTDEDLLMSRELELGASESLNYSSLELVVRPY